MARSREKNKRDVSIDSIFGTFGDLKEEVPQKEEEQDELSFFIKGLSEDEGTDDESQEPVPFVSLHNHSDHSLLDGFGKTIDYVKKAKELGYPGVGLTDHGSLAGIAKMFQECKQEGITFVPGCEFYVAPENPEGARVKSPVFYGTPEDRAERRDVSGRGSYLHISVWAINNKGLNNLFLLSSLSNLDENYYQKPRIDTEMLLKYSEGLVVSTGCPSSEISTRFRLGQDDKAYAYARRLKETFGDRLFVEIMNHKMEQELERELLKKQVELSRDLDIPLLATNDCHYTHKEDAGVHEEFLAIQTKALMKTDKKDRFSFDGEGYYFKSGREMLRLFPEKYFPGAISNTVKIAEWAKGIEMEYNPDLRPKPVIPEGFKNEGEYLMHIVNENFELPNKYGDADEVTREKARKQIDEEYEVLAGSDFLGYMLIVSEYMNWIRDKRSLRDENGKILALPVGVGRGCFMPGSLVREGRGGSLKPIETFKVGDLVRTHDATHKAVTNVWEYDVENEDMLKISLSNGKEILCTSDHKIFMKDHGWIEAMNLSKGDTLLGPADSKEIFNEITVESIEAFKHTGKVYDLEVEDVHNYTVSDVTVHNSGGGSIIAFLLNITELDPLRHELLFERFVSPGRANAYTYKTASGTEEELESSTRLIVLKGGKNLKIIYAHELRPGDVIVEKEEKQEEDE